MRYTLFTHSVVYPEGHFVEKEGDQQVPGALKLPTFFGLEKSRALVDPLLSHESFDQYVIGCGSYDRSKGHDFRFR